MERFCLFAITPIRKSRDNGGESVKEINDVFIIGIDSGYGNIKTANCCFPASVAVYVIPNPFSKIICLSMTADII